MANLNVVILGSPDYAKDLGKKGTASDMTFYNLKKGENTVTFIEPTRYPDRLAPLCFAVSLAQKAILVVEEINLAFGEMVIMLDCAGLKSGLLILRRVRRGRQDCTSRALSGGSGAVEGSCPE
jgi:selenocysteine-specific translation elongation factor